MQDETATTGEIIETITQPEGSDINNLATRDAGRGLQFIHAKNEILRALREASIAMTDPQDWTLFKKPEAQGGGITGFLDDSGCQRIMALWGIDVLPLGGATEFHFVKEPVGDEYLVTVRGDGYCATTRAWLKGIEGCRGSDEDFVKLMTGTRKYSHVRKAAYSNMAGGIVRRHTGLSVVPLDDLKRAWAGAKKDWNQCNKGKGFGGSEKRYGTGDTGAEPKCPTCKGEMRLIKPPAGKSWPAFWGCKKGKDVCNGSVKDADWQKELAARPKAEPPSEEPHEQPREPGEEPQETQTPQATKNLGQRKNEAFERIKGKSYEQELKKQILVARTPDELTDLETLIGDREKENGK